MIPAMTGPFGVDLEAARQAFTNETCPMPHHPDTRRPALEVIVTEKLCTAENATKTARFLDRDVPVREAVIVRCTDDGCHFGREVTGVEGSVARMTHGGLGFVDTPPPVGVE
jgi:hypothetical protein